MTKRKRWTPASAERLEPRTLMAAIGDLVWLDANRNSTRDTGESGIGGASLHLYRDDGDATFDPSSLAPVWINEIHYQNVGADVGEGFEIAGRAGTNLSGWTVTLYNGPATYGTVPLTGAVPNEAAGAGAVWFPRADLQNGPADGLALTDPAGRVVDFISYDGTIAATAGPAAGKTARSIPVAQTSSAPVGTSLQLRGTASQPTQFAWAGGGTGAGLLASPGKINTGQTIQSPLDPGDTLIAVKTSAADGSYSFPDVGPGTYWVWANGSAAPLAALQRTTLANPVKVTTDGTANATSADFGYRVRPTTGSLAGNLWLDLNADRQKTGDVPFVNATIRLHADNGDATFNPGGYKPATAWFNEIHYDNAGADTGEGFEIAAKAGTDLKNWTVALYDGPATYGNVPLSGVIPNQSAGFGTLWFPRAGLQNGPADGLALVDPTGTVVEFLSYEGAITATAGPAAGKTSVLLPVSEDSTTTPVGHSLQRTGTGSSPAAFTWQGPLAASPGTFNTTQTITAPPSTASTDFLIAETKTDSSGNYRFENLPPGRYWIDPVQSIAPLQGMVVTTANDPLLATATAAVDATGLDFGFRLPTATLTGLIFDDADGDGTRDPNEPGLANRTLYIDRNNNFTPDPDEPQALSDPTGNWVIRSIPPGDFTLRQVVPPGWRGTAPLPRPYTGTLSASQTLSGLVLAQSRTVLLSGRVFRDADSNAAFGAPDTGLTGYRVYIDDNLNGSWTPGERYADTTADGRWTLPPLASGVTYRLRVSGVAASLLTTPATGWIELTPASGTVFSNLLFALKPV